MHYGSKIVALNETIIMAFDKHPRVAEIPSNKNLKGVDKSPEEEKDHGEIVTSEDLKGKKVDGDPNQKEDQPMERNSGEQQSHN
jgi:hypothetical protein